MQLALFGGMCARLGILFGLFWLILGLFSCQERLRKPSVRSENQWRARLLYADASAQTVALVWRRVSPETETPLDTLMSFLDYTHSPIRPTAISGDTLHFQAHEWPLGRHHIVIHFQSAKGIEKHRISFVLRAPNAPMRYTYRRVASYPHDPKAYTQGLFFHKGKLYESLGQHGQSELRQVQLKGGQILQKILLDDTYFGEGATSDGAQLYQITWKARKGFVYAADTLKELYSFHYPTQGWGLTYWNEYLVMSDGSEQLYFYTTHPVRYHHKQQVYDNKGPVGELNELETVGEWIYANRYRRDEVVLIDPKRGEVKGIANLKGLIQGYPHDPKRIDVLNGIAYDSIQQRLFFTGKYWPWLFECELQAVRQ